MSSDKKKIILAEAQQEAFVEGTRFANGKNWVSVAVAEDEARRRYPIVKGRVK